MIYQIAIRRTYRLRALLLARLARLVYSFFQTFPPLRRPSWGLSSTALKSMPPGSLGRGLYQFYQEYGLQVMPGFEPHDVFHVLLDYPPSMEEEGKLVFCLLGNGKRSIPNTSSCIMAAAFFPEHWGDFAEAYARGRRARTFWQWQFQYLLREPLGLLRHFIFKTGIFSNQENGDILRQPNQLT